MLIKISILSIISLCLIVVLSKSLLFQYDWENWKIGWAAFADVSKVAWLGGEVICFAE